MNTEMERTGTLPSHSKAVVNISIVRALRLNRTDDAKRVAALLGSATVLRAAYTNNLLKLIDAVKFERNMT